MSNFKVEFTLKQHTPIIHFQAGQRGATLRASELKPKFDRFLKKYAFGGSVPNSFKIDKEKDALDYKVKIEVDISEPQDIPKRDELFFGNMKPKNMSDEEFEKVKKYFKHNKNSFKIEFVSFNTKLIEIIEEYFESFLANTNFGTRQSKGYGSFYLDKPFNPNLIKAKKVYSFNSINWKQDIGLFYKFLRQGINLKNRDKKTLFYTKPAIYLYFKDRYDWEKKAIKEEIINHKKINPENYRILRDIFGLSTSQFWISYRANITKSSDKFERFKSPITFKVIDKKVYFWVEEGYTKILNQNFKINKKLNLKTPKEFDFCDFFTFVKNLQLHQTIDKKYQNRQEFQTLNRILGNLKAQNAN